MLVEYEIKWENSGYIMRKLIKVVFEWKVNYVRGERKVSTLLTQDSVPLESIFCIKQLIKRVKVRMKSLFGREKN